MAERAKTLLQIEKLQESIKKTQDEYNKAVKAGSFTDKERLETLRQQTKEQLKLKKLQAEINKEASETLKKSKVSNDYSRELDVRIKDIIKDKKLQAKLDLKIQNIEAIVVKSAQKESDATGETAKTFESLTSFAKDLNDIQLENLNNSQELGTEKFKQIDLAGKEQALAQLKARVEDKTVKFGKGERVFARNRVKEMGATLKNEKTHAKVLDKKHAIMEKIGDSAKGFAKKLVAAISATALIAGAWKAAKSVVMGFSGLVDNLGAQFGVAGAEAGPLQDNLIAARTEAIGFGKGMDDVVSIATGLSDEFGISIDKASDLASTILDSSTAMGLSADEGAKLFGTLIKIGNLTPTQAEDLAESTYNLAQANKVNPAAVMKDIAANTEVFAKFGGKGSENIMEAAVHAKKLGIGLSDVATIASGLLDFESSMTAELEASMMLGKQLNFQRARQLALQGKLPEMMDAVLDQLGDENAWLGMNSLDREAAAKAVGVEVGVMSKLVGEKARLAKLTPGELEKELKAKKTLSTMTGLLNKFKQMGASLIVNIGGPLEAILGKAKTWLETMSGGAKGSFGPLKTMIDDIGTRIGTWITSLESFFIKTGEGQTGLEKMKESAQKIVDKFMFWSGVLAIAWVSMKAIKGTMAAISIIQDIMAKKQKVMNVLSGIWSAIVSASPVGLIVLAIGAVIGMIAMMIKHWDKVELAIIAVWKVIKGGVAIIFNSVLKPFKDAWKTITGLFSGDIGIVDAIKGIAGAVLDWITWPFRTAMNLIGAIFGIESLGEKIIQPI